MSINLGCSCLGSRLSQPRATDFGNGGGAEGGDRVKRRAAMDEAMHVVKESMTDTGGLGYFHVRHHCLCPVSLLNVV